MKKMVEWLMKAESWSKEDAEEWIDYNTIGSLGQPDAPIVMYGLEMDEE